MIYVWRESGICPILVWLGENVTEAQRFVDDWNRRYPGIALVAVEGHK